MTPDANVCNLTAALARMGGRVELLKQIAEVTREDLPQHLLRLKAAVSAGRAADVQLAAHSIKGMIVNFNAAAAANAAQRLEQMAQANDLSDAEAAARALEGEVARLLTTLTVELAKL